MIFLNLCPGHLCDGGGAGIVGGTVKGGIVVNNDNVVGGALYVDLKNVTAVVISGLEALDGVFGSNVGVTSVTYCDRRTSKGVCKEESVDIRVDISRTVGNNTVCAGGERHHGVTGKLIGACHRFNVYPNSKSHFLKLGNSKLVGVTGADDDKACRSGTGDNANSVRFLVGHDAVLHFCGHVNFETKADLIALHTGKIDDLYGVGDEGHILVAGDLRRADYLIGLRGGFRIEGGNYLCVHSGGHRFNSVDALGEVVISNRKICKAVGCAVHFLNVCNGVDQICRVVAVVIDHSLLLNGSGKLKSDSYAFNSELALVHGHAEITLVCRGGNTCGIFIGGYVNNLISAELVAYGLAKSSNANGAVFFGHLGMNARRFLHDVPAVCVLFGKLNAVFSGGITANAQMQIIVCIGKLICAVHKREPASSVLCTLDTNVGRESIIAEFAEPSGKENAVRAYDKVAAVHRGCGGNSPTCACKIGGGSEA